MAESASPQAAVLRYVADVKSGAYPGPEHCF
jgi:ketopantoate hydroxymethyltransferase